ncbi:DUF3592 domain-containing protein [Thalassovita mediterranea]|nr:DUF3592 domain-containing protein [Thalassovita mediterranea]
MKRAIFTALPGIALTVMGLVALAVFRFSWASLLVGLPLLALGGGVLLEARQTLKESGSDETWKILQPVGSGGRVTFAQIIFTIFGAGALIIGLGVMKFGLEQRADWKALEASAERVSGVVVRQQRYTGVTTRYGQGDTYAPVIRYRDSSGQLQTHVSSSYSSPPAYDRGETVELLVPDCTGGEECEPRLTGGFGEAMRTWGVALFGLVFTVVGLGLVIHPPKEFGDGSAGGGGADI